MRNSQVEEKFQANSTKLHPPKAIYRSLDFLCPFQTDRTPMLPVVTDLRSREPGEARGRSSACSARPGPIRRWMAGALMADVTIAIVMRAT